MYASPSSRILSAGTISILRTLVNARVATAPEALEQVVRDCVAQVGEDFSAATEIEKMQRFRPGRPVPTHRVGA
jgi:hypothetical protein